MTELLTHLAAFLLGATAQWYVIRHLPERGSPMRLPRLDFSGWLSLFAVLAGSVVFVIGWQAYNANADIQCRQATLWLGVIDAPRPEDAPELTEQQEEQREAFRALFQGVYDDYDCSERTLE